MNKKICPKCRNEINENTAPCPYCGYKPESMPVKTCPGCGENVSAESDICPLCGYILKKPKSKKRLLGKIFLVGVIIGVYIMIRYYSADSDTNDSNNTNPAESDAETTTAVKKKVNTKKVSFDDADALLEKGKEHIADDAGIVDGMDSIAAAISLYTEKAEEAGDISLADDKVMDAYASYVMAVEWHKDILSSQEVSGSIYSQIMTELEDAVDLGESLVDKGYGIDVASLKEEKETFDIEYKAQVIRLFDEFTKRDMWSRTESWNLMSSTADNMFDPSDLDNPIRLRYAYALSWWIQKQIEAELGNGTITEKGAAIKIAGLIETMDYNPLMLNYYIMFMRNAGENCSQVEAAYNDMIEHIYQTQGIIIGEDFDLAHFWYFNDFDASSVDDKNGVTKENRQWIRSRMSQVKFVTQ